MATRLSFACFLLLLHLSICSAKRVIHANVHQVDANEQQESLAETEATELMTSIPPAWEPHIKRVSSTFGFGMKTFESGENGKVSVVELPCGQQLALKSQPLDGARYGNSLDSEVAIMQLGNPFIVPAYAYNTGTNDKYYILMPLATGTLPETGQFSTEVGNIKDDGGWEFFLLVRDLMSGLAFMHENSMVHRDIKPSNVYYFCPPDQGEGAAPTKSGESELCRAAIMHFGTMCSLRLGDTLGNYFEKCEQDYTPGTPWFKAPEFGKEFNHQKAKHQYRQLLKGADIYAAGLTILELLDQVPLWRDTSKADTQLKQARALATLMKSDNREERPSAQEVLDRLNEMIGNEKSFLDAPTMNEGAACRDTLAELKKMSKLPSGDDLDKSAILPGFGVGFD